jgi:hypothetical protein
MATATYDKIATQTLASTATSITFSSIPATYTDLRLVFVGKSSSGNCDLKLTFNGDTSSGNYSQAAIAGNGSSALSSYTTSATSISLSLFNALSTSISLFELDVFSYAGSTRKTMLFSASTDAVGSGATEKNVGLWRQIAAISSLTITTTSNTYAIGTTATLYGIKAA